MPARVLLAPLALSLLSWAGLRALPGAGPRQDPASQAPAGDLWSELEAWLGGPRDGSEAEALLARARALGAGREALVRALMAGAVLPETGLPPDLPETLSLEGAGWAARAVEAGELRGRLFERALRGGAGTAAYERIVGPAFQAFVEDVEALRLEPAERLAVALHDTARATWSAVSLALWSTRVGEHERADRVLSEALARTTDAQGRLDLLQRRAIAALGAGRLDEARDHLGHALALGGTDATQILARLALAEGDRRRAARLFGSLLVPRADEDPLVVTPWALRGWGMALLPPEPGMR